MGGQAKNNFRGRKFDFAKNVFLGQSEGAEHAKGHETGQKGFYSAQRAGSKGPETAKIGYFMLKTRKIVCFVWFLVHQAPRLVLQFSC